MFYVMGLTELCQRRQWPDPEFQTFRTSKGYGCTVRVNNREYSTVLEYESDGLAMNAVATRAYMICRNFNVNNAHVTQRLPITIRLSRGNERSYQGSSGWSSDGSLGSASVTTFYSARSRQSIEVRDILDQYGPPTEWYRYLERINLVPVPEFDETNWSGRGQHVEFDISEAAEIDALLNPRGTLGHSATALVEKVQCKRILLARKKIKCSWRLKREDVIKEVGHLQKLRYSHIVRGVGTYVVGNELAILLYPATEHSLDSFLDYCVEEMERASSPPTTQSDPITLDAITLDAMLRCLCCFFECITNTMHFIHSQLVKHMDIKPSNFLVKEVKGDCPTYKIYLADFGISRSYTNPEDVETDSRTACTRTYAAPEVVRQEMRGFGADIFSLGCVFLEMLAVLCTPMQRHALLETRKANPDNDWSYQANIETILAVEPFCGPTFVDDRCYAWLEEAKKMTHLDSQHRPTGEALREVFGHGQGCCYQGFVPFEATKRPIVAELIRGP